MTPWRLVTFVDANAINMTGTRRMLARLCGEVNEAHGAVTAEDSRSISRQDTVLAVAYKVQLIYFRQTGKFLATTETTSECDTLAEIWEEIDDTRRLGRLPGLRPGAGRDLFIVVDVPDHPQRVLHMVTPPFQDEDDFTPPRISTGEMVPLVRVPLAEIPRTSTRDVVKPPDADPDADTVVLSNDEVTPVDQKIPKPPDEK